MRHAEAKNVKIQIKQNKSEIILRVQDDGKGISENQSNNSKESYGIFGMRERVNMLGGKMAITSNAKQGTTVQVTLPIPTNL